MAPRSKHRFPVLMLIALLIAGPVNAGPWPRDAGHLFIATTMSMTPESSLYSSEIYAEYGLRPQLTIAGAFQMDALVGPSEVRARVDHYDLFARWHPANLPAGLALGLSAGLRYRPFSQAPFQPFVGVDIGHGMEAMGGNIWMQAGARILTARAPWGREHAADVTSQIGYRHGRWIGMIGLTHFQTRLNRITRLRPAVGVAFGRLTLVGEAVIPPDGHLESVRLSLWSEF